ncbi:MAG: NUDIX domain-containing protein [Bergeyella sp.]|nr:NUDIX domain-containing protein [Bergeyella sp.]
MENLEYCAKCGEKSLRWNKINKWYCKQCDYVLYHNCAAAVAVILRHKDEIFLTIRNKDPQKGKFDLPGGFVDPKESAEQTCRRELYEELKVTIDINRLKILKTNPNLYPYKGITYNTLDIFYEYPLEEKTEMEFEKSEIAGGNWFSIGDLPMDEMAFISQKEFLNIYKREYLNSPIWD